MCSRRMQVKKQACEEDMGVRHNIPNIPNCIDFPLKNENSMKLCHKHNLCKALVSLLTLHLVLVFFFFSFSSSLFSSFIFFHFLAWYTIANVRDL